MSSTESEQEWRSTKKSKENSDQQLNVAVEKERYIVGQSIQEEIHSNTTKNLFTNHEKLSCVDDKNSDADDNPPGGVVDFGGNLLNTYPRLADREHECNAKIIEKDGKTNLLINSRNSLGKRTTHDKNAWFKIDLKLINTKQNNDGFKHLELFIANYNDPNSNMSPGPKWRADEKVKVGVDEPALGYRKGEGIKSKNENMDKDNVTPNNKTESRFIHINAGETNTMQQRGKYSDAQILSERQTMTYPADASRGIQYKYRKQKHEIARVNYPDPNCKEDLTVQSVNEQQKNQETQMEDNVRDKKRSVTPIRRAIGIFRCPWVTRQQSEQVTEAESKSTVEPVKHTKLKSEKSKSGSSDFTKDMQTSPENTSSHYLQHGSPLIEPSNKRHPRRIRIKMKANSTESLDPLTITKPVTLNSTRSVRAKSTFTSPSWSRKSVFSGHMDQPTDSELDQSYDMTDTRSCNKFRSLFKCIKSSHPTQPDAGQSHPNSLHKKSVSAVDNEQATWNKSTSRGRSPKRARKHVPTNNTTTGTPTSFMFDSDTLLKREPKLNFIIRTRKNGQLVIKDAFTSSKQTQTENTENLMSEQEHQTDVTSFSYSSEDLDNNKEESTFNGKIVDLNERECLEPLSLEETNIDASSNVNTEKHDASANFGKSADLTSTLLNVPPPKDERMVEEINGSDSAPNSYYDSKDEESLPHISRVEHNEIHSPENVDENHRNLDSFEAKTTENISDTLPSQAKPEHTKSTTWLPEDELRSTKSLLTLAVVEDNIPNIRNVIHLQKKSEPDSCKEVVTPNSSSQFSIQMPKMKKGKSCTVDSVSHQPLPHVDDAAACDIPLGQIPHSDVKHDVEQLGQDSIKNEKSPQEEHNGTTSVIDEIKSEEPTLSGPDYYYVYETCSSTTDEIPSLNTYVASEGCACVKCGCCSHAAVNPDEGWLDFREYVPVNVASRSMSTISLHRGEINKHRSFIGTLEKLGSSTPEIVSNASTQPQFDSLEIRQSYPQSDQLGDGTRTPKNTESGTQGDVKWDNYWQSTLFQPFPQREPGRLSFTHNYTLTTLPLLRKRSFTSFDLSLTSTERLIGMFSPLEQSEKHTSDDKPVQPELPKTMRTIYDKDTEKTGDGELIESLRQLEIRLANERAKILESGKEANGNTKNTPLQIESRRSSLNVPIRVTIDRRTHEDKGPQTTERRLSGDKFNDHQIGPTKSPSLSRETIDNQKQRSHSCGNKMPHTTVNIDQRGVETFMHYLTHILKQQDRICRCHCRHNLHKTRCMKKCHKCQGGRCTGDENITKTSSRISTNAKCLSPIILHAPCLNGRLSMPRSHSCQSQKCLRKAISLPRHCGKREFKC